MPHSHHSHSGQFCRHAKDDLESVIQEAIKQGFQTFGLSEHAPRGRKQDLYPEEADLEPSDLEKTYEAFLIEATRLKEVYKDRISILVGIETEKITSLDLQLALKLIRDPRIEYTVGSVHHVGGIAIDFDIPIFKRAVRRLAGDDSMALNLKTVDPMVLEPLFANYLDNQHEMLDVLQPEVVGHFDLCLLYTPQISLKTVSPAIWSRVERNVKRVIEYGGLFEANSAAIRKGWATSYPSKDVLELIISLGGRICLSDDSHGAPQVGLNYGKMRDYLVSSGIKDIWHLVPSSSRQEGDQDIGKRSRVVARRTSDWTDHSFWALIDPPRAEGKIT